MTDELDVLLEEEEELEAELAELLAHRTFYYYRKKDKTAPEEEERSVRAAEQSVEAPSGEGATEWEEETTARLEGLLRQLYQGAAGAEAAERPERLHWQRYRGKTDTEAAGKVREQKLAPVSDGVLYEELSRTRQAARYRRPAAGQRIPLVKEQERPEAAGWAPADVDRAFQIDARRYDGGFSWQ